MADTASVTVIGEALIDLVPTPTPGTLSALPGGSPYNVAIGLARLGVDVSLMARLGENSFGRLLRDRASAEGVDLGAAVSTPDLSTLAVVSLDEQARASYEFYVEGTADWRWSDAETGRLPARTNLLHFGSIAAWTAPGAAAIAALADRVRREGRAIVSYDPNLRPRLLDSPAAARPVIEANVARAHLVKASAEDLDWLYSGEPAGEVATRWLSSGPSLVIITDGAEGARAFRADGEPLAGAGVPVEVADTVGAGDAFTAGFLAALVRHDVSDPDRLAECPEAILADALESAILASALTCRRAGAEPPNLEELEDAVAAEAPSPRGRGRGREWS